ncbi:MAG: dihydropteroate synthase [Alphaproteobacteria bacterium]|nr:dihydropteroate synthase [Alphaproteobacteria bacterium]
MAEALHRRFDIAVAGRVLALGPQPVVMGIVNATPDSFSDGGRHLRAADALAAARQMVEDGAEILDIGGESTRPGGDMVDVQTELDRVMPALDAIAAAELGAFISIDTRHTVTADQALQSGAHILNDVEGLQGEPELADIAAAYDVPVVVMHWDRERDGGKDIVAEMKRFFDRSFDIAARAGISRGKLIVDPGFGFSKSIAENYEILRRLGELAEYGLPILSGTSRKRMIGNLLDRAMDERLAGTVATSVLAYERGAHIFRVHDVRPNRDGLRVAAACLYGPPEKE